MKRANEDVREQIELKRFRYYEVAEKVGISACRFSVWMRSELNEERKRRVLQAVEDLIKERG